MGKLTVVVGGQFGSEGKGAVTARLVRDDSVAVRVAGPNAGHSVVGMDGKLWAFRQLPVAAVVNTSSTLVIAAGSEIDPKVLLAEADAANKAGFDIYSRLVVDPAATLMIKPEYTASEANLVTNIGSTGKGIGAARADRIMRSAKIVGHFFDQNYVVQPTAPILRQALKHGRDVIIEGTQGYGLGLHTKYYPFTTSSDCRAIDFLAMAGIGPWDADQYRVIVVARANPIRVAGNSGPLVGETSWQKLGLKQEYTTVTQKVRRVGQWDSQLVIDAICANGQSVSSLALTMVDHVFEEIAGYQGLISNLPGDVQEWITSISQQTQVPVMMVGTGPSSYATGGLSWR